MIHVPCYTYFNKWSHEASRQVEVGHVGHQAGVILDWMLPVTQVGGVAIEAMWRGTEVWVLASTPGRMFSPHTRGREPLIGVVMGRRAWHVCQQKC